MPLSDYENTPFCQSLETLIFANNTENLFDLLIKNTLISNLSL